MTWHFNGGRSAADQEKLGKRPFSNMSANARGRTSAAQRRSKLGHISQTPGCTLLVFQKAVDLEKECCCCDRGRGHCQAVPFAQSHLGLARI
jgi:hypothetical protein